MKPYSNLFVRLHGVAAVSCLLVYLQATGILPGVVAFGAWLEGSHAVWLRGGPEHLTIVLHHPSNPRPRTTAAAQPPLRHEIASRIFCLLARTGPSPLADHVASFDLNPHCAKASGELKAPSAEFHGALGFVGPGQFSSRVPPAATSLVSSASTVLPSASLRALHVTVLLI